jgi:hypothetical protein
MTNLFNNPDWDPLATLTQLIENEELHSQLTRDIAGALNNHAVNLTEISKILNELNLRVYQLESQVLAQEIEIANLKNRT